MGAAWNAPLPDPAAPDPNYNALDDENRTFGLAMEVVARHFAQRAKKLAAVFPDYVRIFVNSTVVHAHGDTADRRDMVKEQLQEAKVVWQRLINSFRLHGVTLRGAICKVSLPGGRTPEIDLRLRVRGRLALVSMKTSRDLRIARGNIKLDEYREAAQPFGQGGGRWLGPHPAPPKNSAARFVGGPSFQWRTSGSFQLSTTENSNFAK